MYSPICFGNVPLGSVLPIHFGSYDDTTNASVTLTGLAITDVEIYKGITVTQRSSDAGVVLIDTDGIDIDGITGAHGFSIDTGNNTDAGFFAAGEFYNVWVASVTIDGVTVNFLAATFRIVPAEASAGVPSVNAILVSNATPETAADIANATALVVPDITEIGSTVETELGTLSLTEGFSADGATPTLPQILHEIRQGLVDFSISGSTLTVKKMDGTAAMTFTLNDPSNPTSRTRTT